MMKKQNLFLGGILLFSILLNGCTESRQTNSEPVMNEFFAFSTLITQKLYQENGNEVIEQTQQMLRDKEQRLSLYVEGSELDQVNQMAGIAPVQVSEELFEMVSVSKRYCELSEGRFDITIAPLSVLWGVDSEHPRVPEKEEIEKALSLVDYRKVELDEEKQTIFLTEKGMALDLGGIAKGYFCNDVREIYEAAGSVGWISIGGIIYNHGTKPDGSDFVFGIRDPEDPVGVAYVGTLTAPEKVISTTGAYERYFEKDGVIYHHILDPKTGYPSESDLLSVTVICEDGGLADYLSTTLYIAGSEAIESYRNDPRFEVIVIDKNHNIYCSDSLKGKFVLTSEDYQLYE